MKQITYYLVVQLKSGAHIQIPVPTISNTRTGEVRATGIEIYETQDFIPPFLVHSYQKSMVCFSHDGKLLGIHGDLPPDVKAKNQELEGLIYKQLDLIGSLVKFEDLTNVPGTNSAKAWRVIKHDPKLSYHNKI